MPQVDTSFIVYIFVNVDYLFNKFGWRFSAFLEAVENCSKKLYVVQLTLKSSTAWRIW